MGLKAQLARLQKELAECVSCPSSKTQEGKAKIQEISNQIGETESRLKSVREAEPKAAVAPDQSSRQGDNSSSGATTQIPKIDFVSPSLGKSVNVFA